MEKQTPTFIDLFAGIGGFRLGFEEAGYKCVYSCEIDSACQEVYFNNFGEKPQGDITNININEIPDFDVLTAGFPCQPFSICGKRQGFEDTRGTFFFHICEIIEAKQPSVILLENVKYLIHHYITDEATDTEYNLLEHYGENTETIPELEELSNIRERARDAYTRLFHLLLNIAQTQPIANKNTLELLYQAIEQADLIVDTLKISIQEIKNNWNLI